MFEPYFFMMSYKRLKVIRIHKKEGAKCFGQCALSFLCWSTRTPFGRFSRSYLPRIGFPACQGGNLIVFYASGHLIYQLLVHFWWSTIVRLLWWSRRRVEGCPWAHGWIRNQTHGTFAHQCLLFILVNEFYRLTELSQAKAIPLSES